MSFYIIDWAGNHMFPSLKWKSFDDAEAFLCEFFESENMDYEEWRGEYEIVKGKPREINRWMT